MVAVALLWMAAVAYMIYKDHGIIEYIDGLPYYDLIPLIPSEKGYQLNLRERFNKRFLELKDTELRPERPMEIKDSYADIRLTKKVLGNAPKVSLEEGLREIIDCKRE